MVDVGSIEVLVATISVVGFLIFFGSPTVIALVSQAVVARKGAVADLTSDVDLLAQQAAEISEEGALAKYFARAFVSEAAVKDIFLLSTLFAVAALVDIVAVVLGLFSVTVNRVALVNLTLAGALALLFVAVAGALLGMRRLTNGAILALERERKRLVGKMAEFKKP